MFFVKTKSSCLYICVFKNIGKFVMKVDINHFQINNTYYIDKMLKTDGFLLELYPDNELL